MNKVRSVRGSGGGGVNNVRLVRGSGGKSGQVS